MKIAILGSGAIGLYYGTHLALTGHDVHFLLRSGLDEARQDGIRIDSEEEGPHHIQPANAHASPDTIGPSDLIIIALKTTQNPLLTELIPPLLAPDTALLTLQNGLGSDDFLAENFGPQRVLGGLCFVCLTRKTPASVRHVGHGTLTIGEFDGQPRPRTQTLINAFRSADIETNLTATLAAARWRKLVWNVPFNGLAVAAGGLTVDRILADPALAADTHALMHEVLATAAALGHPIPTEFVDEQLTRTRQMGAYAPSTLTDHLAGQELEIDAIWGAPLRRAQAANVPTPRLQHLHTQLRALSR